MKIYAFFHFKNDIEIFTIWIDHYLKNLFLFLFDLFSAMRNIYKKRI